MLEVSYPSARRRSRALKLSYPSGEEAATGPREPRGTESLVPWCPQSPGDPRGHPPWRWDFSPRGVLPRCPQKSRTLVPKITKIDQKSRTRVPPQSDDFRHQGARLLVARPAGGRWERGRGEGKPSLIGSNTPTEVGGLRQQRVRKQHPAETSAVFGLSLPRSRFRP